MNYFPEEEIKKIITEYQTISAKRVSLLERYLERQYQAAKAREYATHGFLRRLKTLVRCIKKVFEILPPERSSLPTKEELVDAEINIQALELAPEIRTGC